MTLKITNSSIEVLNSLGQVKFTSNDKLVYLKKSQSGTISVAGSRVSVPFVAIAANEFLTISVSINSGTGLPSLINPIIGLRQPANGPIVVDFYGRLASNIVQADTEFLHVMSVGSNLQFKSMRYTAAQTVVDGTTTNNITYYAKVFSYL